MQLNILRILPAHIVVSAAIASAAFAGQGVGTAPVGVQPLVIRGSSDNVVSLPMPRPAVFKGYVVSSGPDTLTISVEKTPELLPPTDVVPVDPLLAANWSPPSPGWARDQFVYNSGAGRTETYYLEITTGALAGVSFKITGNDGNSVKLETEGDDLTNYPRLGAIAANDRVQIRPYWRIRDVFEVDGIPLIEPRPNRFLVRDDLLIPVYADSAVGINKAPNLLVHYVAGEGWRAVGQGTADYGDYVLPPHSVLIVRRRNPNDLTLWNAGLASLVRSVTYVPGGNGASANDTYIALAHATPVTLDEAGLSASHPFTGVIVASTSDFQRADELLAFTDQPGFNTAPSAVYYYRLGEGWKQVGVAGTVGDTVTLEPGRGYIIRKKAANLGIDWIKDPN